MSTDPKELKAGALLLLGYPLNAAVELCFHNEWSKSPIWLDSKTGILCFSIATLGKILNMRPEGESTFDANNWLSMKENANFKLQKLKSHQPEKSQTVEKLCLPVTCLPEILSSKNKFGNTDLVNCLRRILKIEMAKQTTLEGEFLVPQERPKKRSRKDRKNSGGESSALDYNYYEGTGSSYKGQLLKKGKKLTVEFLEKLDWLGADFCMWTVPGQPNTPAWFQIGSLETRSYDWVCIAMIADTPSNDSTFVFYNMTPNEKFEENVLIGGGFNVKGRHAIVHRDWLDTTLEEELARNPCAKGHQFVLPILEQVNDPDVWAPSLAFEDYEFPEVLTAESSCIFSAGGNAEIQQ